MTDDWDPFGDDEARARRDDPETSHEAAASVESIRERQRAIYSLLDSIGPMHDEELVGRYLRQVDLPVQSVSGIRTRRSELVDLGLVVHTGEFTKTKSGRRARIWAVAEKDLSLR